MRTRGTLCAATPLALTELTALLDGGPARTVRVPVPRLIVRDSTGAARDT